MAPPVKPPLPSAYALSRQNLDWATSSSEDLAFAIRKAIAIYEA